MYQKKLRECTDLSIYLDVENNLRKYFKINRDIKKSNYKYLNIVQEIKRRKKDSKLYIEKQKKYANLIFQIDPINKNDLKKHRKSASIDTKIKLIFKKRINKLLFLESLSKIVKKFDYKETKDNLMVEINAFDISPYLKTIVLDADTLVTENLDGWWKYLKNYMIFYSSTIRTYRGVIDRSVVYRKVFVRNQLPNLYNTIHYFEKSEEAALFYRMQRLVIENWKLFYDKYTPTKKQKWCSMDVSSAITSKLLCNEDEITAKDSFINVVHLKPKHHGIIHYVEKGFLTDYLIKQLEEANETVLAV